MATKKLRLCVIVPVATTEYNAEVRRCLRPYCPPDLQITVTNIDRGVTAIQDRTTLAINNIGVMEKIIWAEAKGFDGVFVADFDMAGVEQGRELVSIPVVGGCRAQMFTGMNLSQSFSILTIMDSVVDMQVEHVRAFGVIPNFASIRPLDLPVADLTNRKKVIAAAIDIGLECIHQDGAGALIWGCMGFIGVAGPVSDALSEACGLYVPVIDPNPTSMLSAYNLIKLGLRQSGISYAPTTMPKPTKAK